MRRALTGTRIRERRLFLGLKQAELARRVEISPSYLNLIEHNRRSIGGKLLSSIAGVLKVESSALSEGAEAALVAPLREAAAAMQNSAELDRLEDFAGRFPGWAGLLVDLSSRVASLEQTVETLTDRLAHDPFLSDALHDILTTVTAIRSSAGILTDTQHVEPDWQRRFLRNIGEDSERLSGTSKSLVAYLDGVEDVQSGISAPQEELDAFLTTHGYHFPQLDADPDMDLDNLLDALEFNAQLPAARSLARTYLSGYAEDAFRIPLTGLRKALDAVGTDIPALADRLSVDFFTLFRRLACVPSDFVGQSFGLTTSDASGSLLIRKSLDGFPLPKFGAACPLWPIFRALSQPYQPIQTQLTMPGRTETVFDVYAAARVAGTIRLNAPPRYEAAMLFVSAEAERPAVEQVGVSCRICPIAECQARREPTILSSSF